MKSNLKFFIALQITLVSVAFIIIISSFGYSMYQEKLPEPLYIKNVKVSISGDAPKDISLPYNFKHLKPKTQSPLFFIVFPEIIQYTVSYG